MQVAKYNFKNGIIDKKILPATNAFCNGPLNPVFKGPTVAGPFSRRHMPIPAIRIASIAILGSARTNIWRSPPEISLSSDVVLFEESASFVVEREPGVSSLGERTPPLEFGTAGNAPLPVDGTEIASWGGGPFTGSAGRLLDS